MIFFIIFPEKKLLLLANGLLWRQFAGNVSLFSEKKYFKMPSAEMFTQYAKR